MTSTATKAIITSRWSDHSNRPVPERSNGRHEWDWDIQPGAIYLPRCVAGELLYVGSSINPIGRLRAHRRRIWWDEMAAVEVIWYADQVDARAAEAWIIASGEPKYPCGLPWSRYGNPDYPTKLQADRERSRTRYAGIPPAHWRE
jgi:hypothetical protein